MKTLAGGEALFHGGRMPARLNEVQQQIVRAEGNLLVSAGAGTGKTRTLVEHLVARILDPDRPLSVERVLVATFTEAAAAEMRARIADRLQAELRKRPADRFLREQTLLLDQAAIGTLHSFCLRLVREHAFELGIDPRFTVLEPAQNALLARETFDEVLEKLAAPGADSAEALRDFFLAYADGDVARLRELTLRIYRFLTTLPNPEEWLTEQQRAWSEEGARRMMENAAEAVNAWARQWRAALERHCLLPEREAREVRSLLETLAQALPERFGDLSARLLSCAGSLKLKGGLSSLWKKDFLVESRWIREWFAADRPAPGWLQAHERMRRPVSAFLELVREFTAAFQEARLRRGTLDFHDLERFALRLLRRGLGATLRRRFALVYVDECQDINAVQDALIQAVSRSDPEGNRFLVGDLKQSIYGFRLADPEIFRARLRAWEKPGAEKGRVFRLRKNYRSRPEILRFVNETFRRLMREDLCGLELAPEDELEPGDPAAWPPAAAPPVEVVLLAPPSEEEESSEELRGLEREAALVAARLRAWREQGLRVPDPDSGELRPMRWSDAAILLRSPRTHAEAFSKVFHRAGVPLAVSGSGWQEAPAVRDALNLLRLLHNPRQDPALLAALRSPAGGMTPNELAWIRLRRPEGPFWEALKALGETDSEPEGEEALRCIHRSAREKAERFLRDFARWRSLLRRNPLSQAVEAILDEIGFAALLRAEGGRERDLAALESFVRTLRQFDAGNRLGLSRFLRFMEAREEFGERAEPDWEGGADAVRLLSIHQSKGLEFPLVVLAGLGGRFNLRDQHAAVLLDPKLGVCPRLQDEALPSAYPALWHWAAMQRRKRAFLAEELRLLYVAMTRAQRRLLLTGTWRARKGKTGADAPDPAQPLGFLRAVSPLDWLAPLWAEDADLKEWSTPGKGEAETFRWEIVDSVELPEPLAESGDSFPERTESVEELLARAQALALRYPHAAASAQPAKATVTELSKPAARDIASETWTLPESPVAPERNLHSPNRRGSSGVERGAAHHRFLQFAEFDRLEDPGQVRRQAERLVSQKLLSPEEAELLDPEALAAFGRSPIARRIRQTRGRIARELAFTCRLSPADLRCLCVPHRPGLGDEEFFVVQGVADLVCFEPKRLWLLDFKTDEASGAEFARRQQAYETQLRLYALALERVYRRPVTEAWLYFLALRKAVKVAPASGAECEESIG